MITTRLARLASAFALGTLLVVAPALPAGAEDHPDQPVSNQPMADADEDGVFEPAPAADPNVDGEAEIMVEPVLEDGPAAGPTGSSGGVGSVGILAGVLVAGAAAVTAFAVLRRDRLVASA